MTETVYQTQKLFNKTISGIGALKGVNCGHSGGYRTQLFPIENTETKTIRKFVQFLNLEYELVVGTNIGYSHTMK